MEGRRHGGLTSCTPMLNATYPLRIDEQKETQLLIDDIQKRLNAREADLNRVRGQREELKAELGQLKMQESEKLRQVDQIRVLANSRHVRDVAAPSNAAVVARLTLEAQDRIGALMSEVRRLKMKIAADKGDTAIVENLHALQGEQELVDELQAKLK
jgi:E3 ubiquitin-protein ligase BRE1